MKTVYLFKRLMSCHFIAYWMRNRTPITQLANSSRRVTTLLLLVIMAFVLGSFILFCAHFIPPNQLKLKLLITLQLLHLCCSCAVFPVRAQTISSFVKALRNMFRQFYFSHVWVLQAGISFIFISQENWIVEKLITCTNNLLFPNICKAFRLLFKTLL
jgi:hypothetical protein